MQQINNIILIDDDGDEFFLVRDAINKINPDKFLFFSHGCIDIKQIKENKIDLILIDINMPSLDGFQCMKMIRKEGISEIPIVMYSNSTSPEHINRAYDEGASLYIVKPSNYDDMIYGLQKLFELNWSDHGVIKFESLKDDRVGIFMLPNQNHNK